MRMECKARRLGRVRPDVGIVSVDNGADDNGWEGSLVAFFRDQLAPVDMVS